MTLNFTYIVFLNFYKPVSRPCHCYATDLSISILIVTYLVTADKVAPFFTHFDNHILVIPCNSHCRLSFNRIFLCSHCPLSSNHIFLYSSLLFFISSDNRCRKSCKDIFLCFLSLFYFVTYIITAYFFVLHFYFDSLRFCFHNLPILTACFFAYHFHFSLLQAFF